MKDRYLFRGKRIYNGEWVQGPYAVARDKFGIEQHNICIPDNNLGYFEWCAVNPSTICQCTGFKDDNGKLIWENDILFLKDEINEIEWKAIVKFGNPNGEYTYGWQLVPVGEFDVNKDILLWVETETEYMKCEVIGNKFDNPELLEVQE